MSSFSAWNWMVVFFVIVINVAIIGLVVWLVRSKKPGTDELQERHKGIPPTASRRSRP